MGPNDLVDPRVRDRILLGNIDNNIIDPRLLEFFNKIISTAFWLFLVILLFIIIYFALKYITGGKKGAEEIHSRFIPIIIAVILVFFAFTIPIIIKSFFKTFFGEE